MNPFEGYTLVRIEDGDAPGEFYIPTVKCDEFRKALDKRGCDWYFTNAIGIIEDPKDLPDWV